MINVVRHKSHTERNRVTPQRHRERGPVETGRERLQYAYLRDGRDVQAAQQGAREEEKQGDRREARTVWPIGPLMGLMSNPCVAHRMSNQMEHGSFSTRGCYAP